MEPEGSSPYSQELSTGPYPEPERSGPSSAVTILIKNAYLAEFLENCILYLFQNWMLLDCQYAKQDP
jgi:hypothetical protein